MGFERPTRMFTSENWTRLRATGAPHLPFIAGLVGACALSLVLCARLLDVWTRDENHRVQAVRALGPETRVLVSGSSHVFATLNPAFVSVPMMNLAAPVCSYVCVEGIVRGNLAKVPRLEALVLEYDVVPMFYDTLRAYHGDYRQLLELDPEISSMSISAWQKYELWRDRSLDRSLIGPILRFGKFTPEELIHRWRGQRRSEDSVVAPGFANGPETMPPNDDGVARVARHVREAAGLAELPRNEAALRRLLELGEAKHLKLALLRFPHHPSYWAALPPDWQQAESDLLARLQHDFPGAFAYWDFGSLPELREADYRNGDHINEGATERVTKLFDERLTALLEPIAQGSAGSPMDRQVSRAGQH